MTPTVHPRRHAMALLAGAAAASMLGACTTPPFAPPIAEDWHDVPLPGKRRTAYQWELTPEGRELVARADGSASMYRKRVARPADTLRDVEFSWLVQALPEGGDVSDADASDAAARVLFAFGGDHARLSARNQLSFELARTLDRRGAAVCHAGLCLGHVGAGGACRHAPAQRPRAQDRRRVGAGRTAPVEALPAHARADYRLAFGEAPGPLLAVAVMTDGDNTRSQLTTRYRDISLR